ncbi:MAG: helix-turn-helix transcriptional regulator [Ruminococcaceae bacterium]|nr:helix-turn-helix transcriptional regulator [Oscillospiraceae bacterium]
MLGKRIASLRQSYGMSQAELARLLHISPSAVGMYEQGRREPAVTTLVALSKVFEVSVDYLVSGRPDSVQDVAALHRMLEESLQHPSTETGRSMSKEEMVCHLLWALMS